MGDVTFTCLRHLLRAGANANATDILRETALHHAAALAGGASQAEPVSEEDLQAWSTGARLLVEAGADVNAQEISGRTPLHVAHQCGQTAVARLLLNAGATVDAPAKHTVL